MNSNNIAIQNVIEKGLDLMSQGANLREQTYNIWLEYSQNILNIVTKDTTFITNYYNVIMATYSPNLQPYQRLSMCLRYLIGIQSFI